MKLLDLTLENFQGLKSFRFAPKSLDADIYADNGLGKTTVGNALMWLLTGKPITDEPGYDPKPHGEDGSQIHNLDSSVEGSFQLDDGRMLTLKRVQREIWKKKRGSQTAEYSGNTVDYYLDGVPAKEKDYIARIEEICPLDRVPLLTLPRQFAKKVDWKTRRKILLEMCGDVSDEDVLEANAELGKEMPDLLRIPATIGQHYAVDQYRDCAGASMKAINKDLTLMPARIDEAQKAIPEITAEEKAIIKAGIVSLANKKEEIESDISRLKSDGIGSASEQISAIKRQIDAERDTAYKAVRAAVEQKRAIVRKLMADQDDLQRKAIETAREAGRLLSDAKQKEQQREDLMAEYKVWANKYSQKAAEEYTGDTICPTCGRPLPDDQVEKAEANFNAAKSSALESIKAKIMEINQRGKRDCNKEDIAALHTQADAKNAQAKSLQAQSEELDAKIAAARKEADIANVVSDTPHIAELKNQISKLEQQGLEANEIIAAKIRDKQDELSDVNGQISAYTAACIKANQADAQRKRVADLKAEQKKLAAEYEKLEHGIYLCEQFVQAKVKMLDERINKRFQSVRFRLFERQINGGLKDCCDVMVPCKGALVPYESANDAAKTNAGIEIIDALAGYWNASLPIIVDNSESVTRLRSSASQVIRLVVSEMDKQIRVELRPAAEMKESA